MICEKAEQNLGENTTRSGNNLKYRVVPVKTRLRVFAGGGENSAGV